MAEYQFKYTGAEIDAGIDKANKALVVPDTAPDAPRIVAINSDGSQQNLTLGTGISIKNGIISASGGGGGGSVGGGYTLTINNEYQGSYDGNIYILGVFEGVFGWHQEIFSNYSGTHIYTNVICFQNTTTSNGLYINTANAILDIVSNQYMPTGYIGFDKNEYKLFMLNDDATLDCNF